MKSPSAVPWLSLSLVSLWSLSSCATVSSNPYAFEELDACPASMTEQQHGSGVVRCRALCSSYARDFAEFDMDCKCWCAPSAGRSYRAKPKAKKPFTDGQTLRLPTGEGQRRSIFSVI